MKEHDMRLAMVVELLHLSIYWYRRAFGIFVGYSAWLLLPVAAASVVVVTLGETAVASTFLLAINAVAFLLTIWISISLTIITADLLFKDPFDPAKVAAKTRRRFLTAFLVICIVGIIQLVGFLLLIIPGVILSVWYGFAQAEAILNEKPWLVALSNSRELSRGRFWSVLWRFFGGELMLVAVYLAVFLTLENLLLLVGVGPLGREMLLSTLSVIVLPLFVLYSTILYIELKRVKHEELKKMPS